MPNPASLIPTSYKGTDLQEADWSIFLEVISGLSSLPAMRGSDVTVAGAAGKRVRGRQPDALSITLEGIIKASSATHYRALVQQLQALFRPRGGPGPLSVVLEDGTALSANARALSLLVGPRLAMRSAVSVELEAVDPPYWSGAAIAGTEALAATTEDFTIDHPGTEEGSDTLWTFDGPITNPRILNQDNGIYVEFLGTVGAGEMLIIDTQAYTALLDGDNVIGSIRHSGARQWMILEPGVNNMRITGSAVGGSVDYEFVPPYL